MFPGWEPRRFRRKDDGGYSMHKDLERRASMLHTRVNPSPPLPSLPDLPSCNLVARKQQGRVMTPLLRAVGKGEPHRTVPCDSWQGHLFI